MKKDITIVKVGSNTIVDEKGAVRTDIIRDIIIALQKIIRDGGRVVLVTSGAVRLGRISLGQSASAAVAASIRFCVPSTLG